MAVAPTPPTPPAPSAKRFNADGTATPVQIDYEAKMLRFLRQLAAMLGGS